MHSVSYLLLTLLLTTCGFIISPVVLLFPSLDTNFFVSIGGAENIVSTTGSRHFRGLTGCIKNFELGSRNIHLIDNASSGHHVEQCL